MALSTAQNQVATALKELSDRPESVKQMLLAALPHAFGPNVHQFQKEAAALLRKSLEEARAAAGEAQVASSQRVREAQTVLETREADAESTAAAEEDKRTVLNEKIAALEALQATAKSEERHCEEAEAAKAVVAEEQQKLEEAKAEVESVQNGSFRMLLDGGWDDEEVRDACIDGVYSYLESVGADAVLLAALPKALGLRPTECGAFDKIAVDEALRFISDKVAACAAQLAEGEEKFEDVKAEHLGAWAILDVARDRVRAASEMRDAADSALQSATVDKKLALSEVMDQKTTLSTLLSESAIVDAKVQQLDLALSAIAILEAGEEPEEENKENLMVVDEINPKAMAVDQVELPVQVAGAAGAA